MLRSTANRFPLAGMVFFIASMALLNCAVGTMAAEAAGKPKAGQVSKTEIYLPWTIDTAQPVRYAPAVALMTGVNSNSKAPAEQAQRKYQQWVAAGAKNFVNTKRRHWLMLYCPLFNWQSFYTDENARPKAPTNPDDPGYSWRIFDELLGIDAVQKDGVKWLVRINWQSWGQGTPQWLMKGQGVVNNEDNGLGGGMLFPNGKAKNEGLPAFQRKYVQKEFGYFAQAFGKRYRDRAELGGIIFDEIQLNSPRLVRAPDLKDDEYYRGHDNAMLEFARNMPNTAICVYQVSPTSRKEQLSKAINIGFGCADARLWSPAMSNTGPWHPDDPPAGRRSGYYNSAQIYNIAAKKPVGGSRNFWVVGSESHGWVQTGPIPPTCGGKNNILGLPTGTLKEPHEISPAEFMQFHACVPRSPGGYAGLNNVPGLVHASWLILDDSPRGSRGTGALPRSMAQWAEGFAKLGPQGLDCVVEEPYGWDEEIKRGR